MIKKLIKKVKDFWYSTEGTMTMAIAAIMASLTAMLVGPVTVFTYIGAVIVITLGGMAIYIIKQHGGWKRMKIFQLSSQPKEKTLDTIVQTFKTTLTDLGTFMEQAAEEKKVIEDRLQDINNDMDKASKIQTNLKTLLGE